MKTAIGLRFDQPTSESRMDQDRDGCQTVWGDLEQGGARHPNHAHFYMEIFENIIVNGPHVREGDAELLFGDQPVHFTSARDIPNLLKELGIFASTSEARRAGRDGAIPPGFTNDFKASKKRRLWIWNPSE